MNDTLSKANSQSCSETAFSWRNKMRWDTKFRRASGLKNDGQAGGKSPLMRFHWADNAKTFLIFLVVFGHLHYVYAPVPGKNLVYAFHVLAFLFITGFLVPPDFGRVKIRQVLSKWIATYIRAYAFFSAIAIALWWAMLSVKTGGLANPLPALFGALYGVAGNGNGLVHADQPLWYFPFLTTSVLGGWICARLKYAGWVLAISYAIFSLFYQGVRLPWGLDIAGVGTLVFLSGHELRRNYDLVRPMLERPGRALLLGAVMFMVLFLTSSLNGATNLNGAEFGRSGFLYFIATYSGITMSIALSAAVPESRLARIVSIDTLTIFALHMYFLLLFSKLAPAPSDSTGVRLSLMIIISILSMFGCMLAARLIQPALDKLVLRKVS